MMAKNYIDNLSEEVRKGMTEKASQGLWPSWAPIGFSNNRETHRIEPDPVEAPLVTKLFEDATDGRRTLKELSARAYDRGLRSRRTQGAISVEGIRRILKNPLYWGPFRWKGKLYQGSHEPLISKQVFDDVQVALRVKGKPRRGKHSFAFTGLASCKCGRRLVGSKARGRYVYYTCSARCGTPPIKESRLSELFLGHVEAIQIDAETAAWILEAIKGFEAKRRGERKQSLARHQERQRKVQATIDSAYDDKLAGRINEEYWTQRFNGWQEELATIRAAISDLESATFNSLERADELLKLCRKAPQLYVSQSFDEQSRLLRLIESNSRWDGVTLTATYRKPFDQLAEGLQINSGGAEGCLTQTLEDFARTLDGFPEESISGLFPRLQAA